ncbi:hypothetical protein MKL09_14385 [Methylobacterium sp. J-048]|uniref:hypothetical protein n=1 Tax=Methylobacterium sp. J-048 TaxID=2836635 RepID=UPI001FBA46DB|nr:hypothetical protein [Methylobacterium sp. J-048]MCJ2057739.1 hypothetical protein [Methylobacterium sp. J-048]
MPDADDVSSTSPTGRDLDRARRAARARDRRAAKGATPRSQSKAALVRLLDLNPNTVKSWHRRNQLRAERDRGLHPFPYPAGADDGAPQRVPDPPIIEAHPNAYHSGDDAGAPDYVPSHEVADLLHRVSYLPGGAAPAFQSVLEGLLLNASATRADWSECDPDLRALLAAE